MPTFDNAQELKVALAAGQRIHDVAFTPVLTKSMVDAGMFGKNRSLRESKLKKVTRAQLTGRWNPKIPGTILFNHDGKVVDGQHRLIGSLRAGKTLVCDAIPDVEDTFGLDEGDRRTEADYLSMRGFHEPTMAAQVARGLFRLHDEGGSEIRDVVDFYEANEAFIQESIVLADAWLSTVHNVGNRLMKPTYLALARALAIKERGIEPSIVDQVLLGAVQGGGDVQSPTRRLYALLVEKKPRVKPPTPQQQIRAALKAIEQAITGKHDRLENAFKEKKAKKVRATEDTGASEPSAD